MRLLIERFVRDARDGARQLRRTPAFTLVAIATLTLGIGLSVTMFAVTDTVLLRPLPYRDADRLFAARTSVTGSLADGEINARHFLEWRLRCRTCERIAIVGGNSFTLGGSSPEQVPGYDVSYEFFRTLGVVPAIGRDFLETDEGPNAARVVILADGLWRRRFGADPAIVGQMVMLNGAPFQVIGVMPRDLRLPRGEQWGRLFNQTKAAEIFLPFRFAYSRIGPVGQLNYAGIVRLRPGTTSQQAAADLSQTVNALLGAPPKIAMHLVPMQQQVTGRVVGRLRLFSGAVAALLLIACVNVGNLLLVRSTTRARDAAIRMAVGASRAAITRLALAEVSIVVVGGLAGGICFAYGAVRLLAAAAPAAIPRLDELTVDTRVLAFAVVAGVLSTLVCGVVPAWKLAAGVPQATLRAASSTLTDAAATLRMGRTLVAVEVAASTVLVIVGGLLITSFVRVLQIDLGFAQERALAIDLSISPRIPQYRTDEARVQYIDRALAVLRGIPGAGSVGATSYLPLQGETWIDDVSDADHAVVRTEDAVLGNYRFVSPGYWQAMGIALREGRYFDDSDRGRDVVVVSERVARFLWPRGDAVGHRLRGGRDPRNPNLTVVGVVADVRTSIEESAPLTVYEPYWSNVPNAISFVVRSSEDPATLIPAVRAALRRVDASLALDRVRPMDALVDESTGPRRFQTILVAGFALSALFLAAIGIYGVISFTVTRRTRELGVRAALGATPRMLLAAEIRHGMRPAVAGLVVGLAAAVAAGRFVAGELYGVAVDDARTFILASTVLLVTALAACWWPARRAAHIDPLTALRWD